MLKKFLMKQAMKSQLKGVPEDQQEMLLDMVEKNPAFFEDLAKEMQDGLAAGKDQQAVMMELMQKHRDELAKMMGK
jgi:GTP cyclohydrolase FolE2